LIGSRERNGEDANGTPLGILHGYETTAGVDVPNTAVGGGGTDFFNHDLITSFSFLNVGFGNGIRVADFGGAPFDVTPYRGFPASLAFALHPWLNRQFASPYELMLVPTGGPARLQQEFTLLPQPAVPTRAPYLANSNTPPDPRANSRFPFGHLLNFFQQVDTGGGGLVESAGFSRIFEFTETPAPFRGERELISPALVQRPPMPTSPWEIAQSVLMELHQPPFNTIDHGVRNGRMNLNTMADVPAVYQEGLLAGHFLINGGVGINELLASRRGYVAQAPTGSIVSGGPTFSFNPGPYRLGPVVVPGQSLTSELFPTSFAAPFRSTLDADLAPLLPSNPNGLRREPVRGGLLRGRFNIGAGNESDNPMFVRTDTNTVAHRNGDRNPLSRYETLMKLPNLTTSQSNVFLVRLTMGYFEVDPTTLGVGREYGADEGKAKRYQGLYIIDRTVPVAYERGKDHNVRDTILFQQVYAR
jgi:hypothetical protein